MAYSDPEQKRRYQREWRQKRRQEWLNENGPCQHCGSSDDLEVHHVDPEKKVSSNVWSWSLARRLVELAKCIVLCGECHDKETAKLRPLYHGQQMYSHHGCRCEVCTMAHKESMQDWRAGRVAA